MRKPRIAQIAQNIHSNLEEFFDYADMDDEIYGFISENEMKVLEDAYDILLEFDREYSVDKGYRSGSY